MARVLGVVVLVVVLAGGAKTVSHLANVAAQRAAAMSLIPLYQKWKVDGGSPRNVLTNYVIESSNEYFCDDGHYVVGGVQKTGVFGLRSPRLPAQDHFVVTTDGVLMRVRATGEPVVLTIAGKRAK